MEALGLAEQVIEAAEPVRQYQQYVDEIEHSPEIGIDRSRFDHVVVIVDPVDLEEPWKPEHWITAQIDLQQIERQQSQHIEDERFRLEVMAGQLLAVVNHEALLEIAGAKLDAHVEEEYEIGKAVAAEPERRCHFLKLRHTLPDDEGPEIVEDTGGQQHEPVVVKVLVRIDHSFRWFLRPTWPASSAARVLVVGLVALALARIYRLLALGYLSGGEALEKGILALERWLFLNRRDRRGQLDRCA